MVKTFQQPFFVKRQLLAYYLSFTPLSYKIGLVKTLIHRAFKIYSSWCLFHDEVNNIKKYLEKNSYP